MVWYRIVNLAIPCCASDDRGETPVNTIWPDLAGQAMTKGKHRQKAGKKKKTDGGGLFFFWLRQELGSPIFPHQLDYIDRQIYRLPNGVQAGDSKLSLDPVGSGHRTGCMGNPVGRGRRRRSALKAQRKKDPQSGSYILVPSLWFASAGTGLTHLSPPSYIHLQIPNPISHNKQAGDMEQTAALIQS